MAGFCSACKCLTGKPASLDCAGIYHLLSTFFSGSQNMLQEILGYFWLWLPTKEPKNMFVSTDRAMGEKAAMLAIDLCRTFIYMFAQLVLIVLAPEHVVIEWGMFVVHCCFAPFLWAICLPRPHQYPHSDSRLRECQQIPPSVVTMEQLWVIPEYPWWHDSVPNSGKPTSSKLPMGAMGAMVTPLMVWPTTVVDNA